MRRQFSSTVLLFGLPFLPLPVMAVIFTLFSRRLGAQAGYLLGFAIWHFAPQTVFPAENVSGFVLSTFFLGLVYGFIAYRTGSARWTAISHSLSGILALSGHLAPSFLTLIGDN